MSRLIHASAFALLLLALATTPSRAGLVISLSDVTVNAGSMATMDISVTSNAQDTLSSFNLELLITPVAGTASLVQFTADQPNPFGNPNYVFDDSFASNNNLMFWGPTGETNYPSDTITGGDSSDPLGSYVTLSSTEGTPFSYLGSVQFEAPQGASAGDQFQVSLVTDPNQTYFDDMQSNALVYEVASGGLITIASAVPEPPSSILTLIGLGGLVGYWCHCRRGTGRKMPAS